MSTSAEPRALVVEDHPDQREVEFLEDRVMAATVAATGCADVRPLAVFVRDDHGSVQAGIYGWTWGGCCELQSLWVNDSIRGQGLARALLESAESEARRRGCGQVVLFTHDSQAAALYPRLGYGLIGTVDGYPRHGAAHWFRKPLSAVG